MVKILTIAKNAIDILFDDLLFSFLIGSISPKFYKKQRKETKKSKCQ